MTSTISKLKKLGASTDSFALAVATTSRKSGTTNKLTPPPTRHAVDRLLSVAHQTFDLVLMG
jgi:hypothetical protein